MELLRCIKEEFNVLDYSKIVIVAVQDYNLNINSTTNQKPFDNPYNKTSWKIFLKY